MIEFTCTRDIYRIIHEKKADIKKTLHSHHFIEKEKLRKYLSGILSIDIDGLYIEKKKTVHQLY